MPVVKPLPVTTGTALGGTASLVLNKPSGLVVGDILIVFMTYRGTLAGGQWDVPGRPAGFTWIATNVGPVAGSAPAWTQVGWRTIDGTEPASWSFPALSGAGRKVGLAVGVRNGTTPLVVATNAGNSAQAWANVTPGANNSLILGWIGYVAGAAPDPVTAPNELVQWVNTTASGQTVDGALIQKYGQPSGTPVAVLGEIAGDSNGWSTVTIAIPPGAGSDGPETELRETAAAAEYLYGTGASDLKVTSLAVEVLRSSVLLPEPPAADESNEEAAIYLGNVH